MADHTIIHNHLEAFFEDQNKGIERRISQGGPISDIRSALSVIRNSLPKYNETTELKLWILSAQEVLEKEKIRFRREHEDESGWGSATFTEFSDSLFLLKRKHS